MHCKSGPKAVLGHLGNYELEKAKSSNPVVALKPIPIDDNTVEIRLTDRDRILTDKEY